MTSGRRGMASGEIRGRLRRVYRVGMPRRVRPAGMMPLTADLTLAVGLFVLGVLRGCVRLPGRRGRGAAVRTAGRRGPGGRRPDAAPGVAAPAAAWGAGGRGGGAGQPGDLPVPVRPVRGRPGAVAAAHLRCGPSSRLARCRRPRDFCWRGRCHVCGCAGDAGAGGDSVQRSRHRGCLAGGAVCGRPPAQGGPDDQLCGPAGTRTGPAGRRRRWRASGRASHENCTTSSPTR